MSELDKANNHLYLSKLRGITKESVSLDLCILCYNVPREHVLYCSTKISLFFKQMKKFNKSYLLGLNPYLIQFF